MLLTLYFMFLDPALLFKFPLLDLQSLDPLNILLLMLYFSFAKVTFSSTGSELKLVNNSLLKFQEQLSLQALELEL